MDCSSFMCKQFFQLLLYYIIVKQKKIIKDQVAIIIYNDKHYHKKIG